MILTCPECATSYFVDDARIPPEGRTVKCTSCGARWKAERDGAAAAEAETPAAPAQPDPLEDMPAGDAEAAEAEPVAPEAEAVAEPDPEEAPAALRPRPQRTTQPAARPARGGMGAAGAIALWAVMAAVVAGLIAGAVVFRGQVVRLWPASSGAYAAMGLPVEGLTLVIEKVKVEAVLQGGRPVLSVTGSIRNVGDHAARAPSLRFNLLDRKGEPVAAKIARPLDASVPAKGRRYFAVAIADPPSTVHDLEVAFEGAPSYSEIHEAAPHRAAEAVVVPDAVEARPLPAGSPDALPESHPAPHG